MFALAWWGFNAQNVREWWHNHLGGTVLNPDGRAAAFADRWALWGGRLVGVVFLCVGVVLVARGVAGLVG